MTAPFTIGFLGAGQATQAIHLPALAAMPDLWRVGAVMDVNAETARIVADRCGARGVTDAMAVIEDPAIDVVAINSPHVFHAEQLIAAAHAGKRAALVEKPLAVNREQAEQVAAIAAGTGMKILVGTMHWYDPGFRAGLAAWEAAGATATRIRSAIFVPPNAQFVGAATEEAFPAPPPPAPPAEQPPEFQRERLRQTILGLAVHHIPLVRRFLKQPGIVVEARRHPPFGYSLLIRAGDQVAELLAVMPGQWPPSWTFEASGPDHRLHVDFGPSYIAGASGRALLSDANGDRGFAFGENGYAAQWRHLHDALTSDTPLDMPVEQAIEDLAYALDLADAAADVMEIVA
jgi:predicted dehydrogenase